MKRIVAALLLCACAPALAQSPDLNADGEVNFTDLGIMKDYFFEPWPPTARLCFDRPLENTDGSPLAAEAITGYKLYRRTQADAPMTYWQTLPPQLGGRRICYTLTLDDARPATYTFHVTTVVGAAESEPSNTADKVLP